MKKILFIAIITLANLSVKAQDWCSWSFQYDFKIKSSVVGHNQFDSLEIFLNEPFQSGKLRNSNIKYNDNTFVYSLNLEYGCVSCGYSDAEHPPTIFLRLFIANAFFNQKFSIIIPITFDNVKMSNILIPFQVNLGTIYINEYLVFNSTLEKYDGIRVKSNGEIYKYKKGEYLFPQTKKTNSG